MLEEALRLARAQRAQAEADLVELASIPSVSSLQAHRDDCRRAAGWLAGRFRRLGLKTELVDVRPDGHPVLVGEWMGRKGRPTLTIYGHYDVQPADPLSEWVSPPFEPSRRDGFLYARGASDNKGQHLAAVKAVEYGLAAGGPPLNLRFLFEGEEEISGPSLGRFVRAHRRRLHTDYLFIGDGDFVAPGRPCLVTGMRGLLYTEIEATGAAADLHSGLYGGVAPNPLNTLAWVIATLKRPDGRVTIPGFYDRVRKPSPAELRSWRRLPLTAPLVKREMGVYALEGEARYSPIERRWARPTLDVHGIAGGFVAEGSKTVIPARARAKLSMRLVPDQDPDRVLRSLRAYLRHLGTPGVKLTLKALGSARPVLCGSDHPGVGAARRAFQAAFGAEPAMVRSGGSIPVVTDFQEALKPRLLVSGFGLPGDGLHSPNERMSLDQYHRGTEMVLHLMQELAGAHR